MKKTILRFSENIQLVMGLCAAIGVALASHYLLQDTQFGGVPAATVGYAVAAWLALWSLRSVGVEVMVTPTAITRKSPLGEVRVRWDEMDRLEIGPSCWWLVFHGQDGKRIWMRKPFSSFASWFKDEDDADYEDPILASLLEMAAHHGVPMEGGILTPFKTSRA
jgi:hypothetical protein